MGQGRSARVCRDDAARGRLRAWLRHVGRDAARRRYRPLLRSNAPYASVDEIERALERTARPVQGIRFGRVDAFAALRALGRPGPRFTPRIVGYPYVGAVLTGYTGVWAGAQLAARIRWIRCADAACRRGATIARGPAYTVRTSDRGHRLRISVSAPGVTTASSRATPRVR